MTQAKAVARLTREYADLKVKPIPGIEVNVNESDFLKPWEILFAGPKGTPYEGGKFHLIVTPPVDYPFKRPTFSFSHKIYHTNVLPDGSLICTEAIDDAHWRPGMKIVDGINVILKLIEKPEPEHALDAAVGVEYDANRAQYEQKAREWTRLYAK
ncbi:MAG: putative signal peptidase I [Streblomastix strix]|uniref:Putative signal peptidase I n=1 Tax=Streblomastix strix TaxID=222440 RepID=A0A5J4W575_9EUKA|nr:MAG: putative signal peptidase I [Streblomastix strix]